MYIGLKVISAYKEWDEPVVPVLLDRLPELVAPEAELLIALNVSQLHQADQTRLLYAGVGLGN